MKNMSAHKTVFTVLLFQKLPMDVVSKNYRLVKISLSKMLVFAVAQRPRYKISLH